MHSNLELEVGESGLGHFQRRLVATAADRVCLERGLWTGGGPSGGRAEIEYLWLAEVDESGRLVSGVLFDPEDRRAASREAWGRWLARHAGRKVPARAPGAGKLEPLEDAPGSYVKVRASE